MTIGNYDIDTWREADVALQRILDEEPADVTAYVSRLDLEPAVRECLDRLLRESQRSGVLDGNALVGSQIAHNELSGRVLGGWTLEEQIGKGGMALVYKARRPINDFEQLAAIKLLPRGMTGTSHFLREQEVLSRLQHPHIARFLDGGVDNDGTPWIAMELVEGSSVMRYVNDLPTRDTVTLFLAVVDAVAYSHQHLVIHRDIKPSNILVDTDGHPKLLDFGIAKLISDASETASTRILTPEFAAPEQFSGAPVSTATDVHGLGATLYTLLGNLPPQGRDGKQERHEFFKSLDPDLRNIIDKCLRENPQDRYTGAAEFGEDLRAWLEDLPVKATPESRRYRLKKWYVRHRAAAIGAALVLIAFVGGTAGIAWQAQQTQRHATTVAAQLAVLTELLSSPQSVARGKQVKMVDVLADADATIRKFLPEQSIERAELFSSLARTLTQIGAGEEAIPMWEQAISDLRVADGGEARYHSYQTGLAHAYLNVGANDEAREIADRLRLTTVPDSQARAIAELISSRAHRVTEPAVAIAMLDDLIDMEERVQWRDPAAEGEFRCGLLQALVDAGRSAQAATQAEHLLAWGSEAFGKEHSHTLCAYQALPVIYAQTGDLERAEKLAREGSEVATRWLGEQSDASFRMRHNLANILEERGSFDAAIALHSELLAIAPSVPGLTAADRILPAMGLAVAYQESGQYAKAEPVQIQVIEHLREEVGAAAPTTLIAIANLAELRIFSGDPGAAIDDATYAYQTLESMVGAEHPVTLFARSVLGGAHAQSGDLELAFSLLENLPDKMAAAFGPDDINVMNARLWLASAMIQAGQAEQAAPTVAEVYQWRSSHLGPDHPQTLATHEMMRKIRVGR